MIECPVCGAEVIAPDDAILGELLDCEDCGTELEVTGLEPLAVEIAPESDEDWGQ